MLDDLFERAGELGRIDGLLDGARAGTGGVLVVTGPARRALTAMEGAAGAAPPGCAEPGGCAGAAIRGVWNGAR